MPKYRVVLTRDATESCDVIVEADNPQQANEAALEQAGSYGENFETWTLDDGNMHRVYLPDPGSTALFEDNP